MNYQTVATKVSEFLTFKAQIQAMALEIEQLESNPPKLDKDVLTWEEAVSYAENKKSHAENLEKLRMGIANRQEIVKNKEKEIGELLPVQNHYILFKLIIDGKEQTYKIGYFPESYGFRMERVEEES
jgi:hypothetical protein